MLYLLAVAAVIMAWTLLRILGDERQRRVQVLRASVEHELSTAAEERRQSR
jgi:hypothetical protein